MAGAVVQSVVKVDDISADALTFSHIITGVTAGNTLLVHMGWGSDGNETCTVSDGTSYTSGAAKVGPDGNGQSGQVFYLENAGAGSHTVTATMNATAGFFRMRIVEVSGLQTSSSLDRATGQAQGAPGTGANAVSSGASAATTNATDFVMGFTQDTSEATTGSGTLSAGTGYTIGTGSTVLMGYESKSVAATGAQTATFTQSAGNARVTHVLAFKEAATAASLLFAPGRSLGALLQM